MNFNFDAYYHAMRVIDECLGRGVKSFPESEELRLLVTRRNNEFNMTWPDFSSANYTLDSLLSNGANFTHDPATEADTKYDAVLCTPFTQILNEQAFDILENYALTTVNKRKQNQCATKPVSHDRPITADAKNDCVTPDMKMNDENAIPLGNVAHRRTKRFIHLTDKLRSPNFNRVVDPNRVLSPIEKRVSGWIFAGFDSEWDVVFESNFGDTGYRGIFESMIPGSEIHATVIDIWVTILNHQEQRRNKRSPLRMFVSCTLLSNFVLDETICINKRYKRFAKRMNHHVERYKQLTDFNVADLVFFPVVMHNHYYLIVFDLKKTACIIIDNMYNEESIPVKYGNIPEDLKTLFIRYIESLKHPKSTSMKHARPIRFDMEWMTKQNFIDCGIFLMRHMETYKGEDVDKWTVHLEPEVEDSNDQQVQLNELRKKYVTKMLTSNLNLRKPFIYSNLPTYDKISDAEKKEFTTEEHLSRIEDRISFFV